MSYYRGEADVTRTCSHVVFDPFRKWRDVRHEVRNAQHNGHQLDCDAIVISSIRVGSSSLARELLTRFDTGHFCSKSFGAGFNNSRLALPLSYDSKFFSARRTGMRSCTSAFIVT